MPKNAVCKLLGPEHGGFAMTYMHHYSDRLQLQDFQ
jgi:hypothetical protein